MIMNQINRKLVPSITFMLANFSKRYIRINNKTFQIKDHGKHNDNFENILHLHEDKILYNNFIHSHLKSEYKDTIKLQKVKRQQLTELQSISPLPLALKYMKESTDEKIENIELEQNTEKSIYFPYGNDNHVAKVDEVNTIMDETNNNSDTGEEIKSRFDIKNDNNWMTDYENYDEGNLNNIEAENYGTPDPSCLISNVPCGGCGAFLHCRDISLPGYIPSEIYNNCNIERNAELKTLICQRCHFLKNYNVALQVHVSQQDYPQVLRTIKNQENALVILIVDLLDFPCSIWPGIPDLIGYNRPIFVVGNKLDLLPMDGKGFLERVKNNLLDNVKQCGFAMANIKHVALISAKTGFGIEELITKLHNTWKHKSDVYLVGCTNVGKSSLFNVLLQSDYCKSQASDLIQRATTSPWPGTTLNLLKFPILRPSGWKLHVRTKRLMSANKLIHEENKLRNSLLRQTKNPKYATLMGYLDRTFNETNDIEQADPFALSSNARVSGVIKMGINENDPKYALSKWCYDTPGVVQPDQITDLLTAEELLLTFPKMIIRPKTFYLKEGYTIFIGGLSRLDYIEGASKVYFTVFCANTLPITICETKFAENLYQTFLGTPLFAVPSGNKERLKLWPKLKASKNIKCTGIDINYSCNDVVLSSSGWISVTCAKEESCVVKGWTPEGRGIFVRDSLLPKSVTLRGKKIRSTPAYSNRKFYTK